MKPRIILPITICILLGVFFLAIETSAKPVNRIGKSPIFSYFDTGKILHWLVPKDRFSGKVIRVIDGDTISVLKDKEPVRIRLYGIDCPEKKQAFGKKAKQFTS
jgi:endonuclease YncB( thermonuclease family)